MTEQNISIISLFTLLLFCGVTNGLGRSRRSAAEEGSTLIVCEGGQFIATCPYGTSVNVTVADYGRTSNENICAKQGMDGSVLCKSASALSRAKKFCGAKTRCSMKVSVDTLGRPVTSDEESCYDTSKYLRLVYTCVRDCQPPSFDYKSEVVGKGNHVTSKVKVHCREGYEQIDGQVGGVEKTCMDDQTWFGPTLLCQDQNECATPSTNRCHMFAKCMNTRGSYSCTCINGYHGDGITCTADSWFKDDDWSDSGSNKTGTSLSDEWDEALIEVHNEKVCGKRIIKKRQGVLKSPRSPLNYPSNAFCVWIIAVPPGLVIELRFMKFDLEREQRNEGCSRDNVTLYDGLNRDPKWWLGSFCGDEPPPTMMSQTNKVRIEFRSDDSAQFAGFEIRFTAINLNFACLNFPAPSYRGIMILNGTRNSTTQPRKTLLIGCADGYTMTSATNVRTCQDNGKWDDFSNPCTPVSCGYPHLPIDSEGLIVDDEPERFRYGEQPVRYRCKTGYTMRIEQGFDDLIICDKKGKWSNEQHGVIPWCEPITCVCYSDVTCAANDGESPPHKALRWEVNDHEGRVISQPIGQTFSYGSRIEYSCADGFVISGDDVRLCTADGWSGRRTSCEEAPFAGLTNYHIAIIASASSGFIILLVTIALIICCCRDHKKKSKKRREIRNRRARTGRDNDGFTMNMALAGNEDFLYGNTVDRRNKPAGFAGRHNNLRKYQERPYLLPASGQVPASRVTTPRQQQPPTTRPTNGAPPSRPYNVEIRPNMNRTFRPSVMENRSSPMVTSQNQRTSSVTKVNPPPGYMDPPPSYDTMVRQGYSDKQIMKNKRR
uniref:uncharacterized protein LOC120338948 n=1 Tax=Styela clava TaxID=7725 RepID=UPI00193A367C|nr:uncharacterized protein LOC120338948 [Styela clava]